MDAGISHSGNVVKSSIAQGFYPACDHGTRNRRQTAYALGNTDHVQAKWQANGKSLTCIVGYLCKVNSQVYSRQYR